MGAGRPLRGARAGNPRTHHTLLAYARVQGPGSRERAELGHAECLRLRKKLVPGLAIMVKCRPAVVQALCEAISEGESAVVFRALPPEYEEPGAGVPQSPASPSVGG